MNDIPYTKTITPRTKAFVVIIGLLFIGIIIGYVISLFSLDPQGNAEFVGDVAVPTACLVTIR